MYGDGGGGQRPVVACLGWWQVAVAEVMSMTDAASAMAEAMSEAMSVMVVAAAAAVAGRRSRRSGLVRGGPARLRTFVCARTLIRAGGDAYFLHM